VNRRHVTVISLMLALALALGVASVLRTVSLGGPGTATAGELAAQNAQLSRYEAQLRAAAQQRPPALTAAAAEAPEQVVYALPQQAIEAEHGDHDDDLHESGHGDHDHDRDHDHDHDHGGDDD
jgi:hypothetical protein